MLINIFITTGVYANMLMDRFQQISTKRNKDEPRLELLCASEIIVAASISALTSAKVTASTKCGEDFAVVPKPGDALILELHKNHDGSKYYVKVKLISNEKVIKNFFYYISCSRFCFGILDQMLLKN